MLVGIREARDLATYAMRGARFETWVVGEMLKHGCNCGEVPELRFCSTGSSVLRASPPAAPDDDEIRLLDPALVLA